MSTHAQPGGTRGRVHALVARDDEQAALAGFLRTAAMGEPQCVVIEGTAGSGKTALVQAFLASNPLLAVVQANGASWLSDVPGSVLGQLDGEAGGRAAAGDYPAAASLLANGLRRATVRGPCVVWVDDLHWADEASLRVLTQVLRRLADGKLLILLALRSGEVHRLPAGCRDLIEGTRCTRLPVPPLDGPGVRELALARFGIDLSVPLAHRLAAHADGNARHIQDLLRENPPGSWRQWRGQLPAPRALALAMSRDLAAVQVPTRRLVEAATVLGLTCALADAASMAGLDDPLAALDEATARGLLVMAGDGGDVSLAFNSPAERAAAYYGLDLPRRTGLHRAAAARLADPGDALAHRAAATLLPDAGLAAELEAYAAGQAEAGAWSKTAAALLAAGHLHPTTEGRETRLLQAIDAMVAAGELQRALTYADEIGSYAPSPRRDAVSGYISILQGRRADADAQLEQAWRCADPHLAPALVATVAQRRVLDSLVRLNGVDLVEWAQRAGRFAEVGSPAYIESEAIKGLGLGMTGRTAEAEAGYEALLQRGDLGAQRQRVRMAMGWLHVATDQVGTAREELAAAVSTDFSSGSYRISLWAQSWLAQAEFLSGEWDAALRIVDEALVLQERTGMELVRPLLHAIATRIHALRGNWEMASWHLHRGRAHTENYPIMVLPYRLAQAHLAEAKADYDGVLRALEPLLQIDRSHGIDEPGFWPWQDVYANALVMKDRTAEASDFLAPFERSAAARGRRSAIARLSYVRGRILGAQGKHDAAKQSFEAGLASLHGLNLPYERARVDFAYGQTLRRAGKRREAAVVLERARDEYIALAAAAYVERCERELQACGSAVTRKEHAGLSSLTAQEQAVAKLVAGGASNKQAAEELFVSIKTVQYHLTRTYAKLGVGSRTELAARYRAGGGTGAAAGQT